MRGQGSGIAARRLLIETWLRALSAPRAILAAGGDGTAVALLNALRNVDAFASRIGARARRGLNRLRAITATRPPHDAPSPRLTRAVAAADSS
ncbi:MAG: hypothetical protein ABL932_02520 [Terricaulis sp.]